MKTGNLKAELTLELHKILEDLEGLYFDAEVKDEIRIRCVKFLKSKGISSEKMPTINIIQNKDGFIDVDMVYSKNGVWN